MKLWSIISTLVIATSGFPSLGDDSGAELDGLEALISFEASLGGQQKTSILGMVGFFGQPHPPQWLILTENKIRPGVLRESVVASGKVVAERKVRRLPNQDLPDIPVDVPSLKVSSIEAFRIAEKEATKNKLSFESMHYQLRCRDLNNEPVWTLNLINRAQVSLGVVYVSALSGNVMRTQWVKPAAQEYSSVRSR